MLGKIFRHCPSDLHETLRRVSKRWDSVIERYVGRVLIVTTGNTFLVDPESNLDRMSIRANYWMTLSSDRSSTANSPSCNQTDTNENTPTATVVEDVEKLQDISSPESVRKIGFVGQLGLSGYRPVECIISPCKNITSLYLHLSLFTVSKEESTTRQHDLSWLASYCLPHLKELVVDSSGVSCEDSSNRISYKDTFLSMASFLCLQKFVCLDKLIISIPYMESVEGVIVRALCIFLGKHAESLKYFSFTQKYQYDGEDDDSVTEDCSNVNEDDDNQSDSKHHHQGDGDRFAENLNFSNGINYLSLRQLALSAKELKNVVLEEFHVVLATKQESAPVWKNLLITQKNLKKCIFAGDKIPLPEGTILVNAPYLVTIRLDIRDGVDLSCFETCVHLRHLSLGGRHDANESRDDEDDEEVESCMESDVYEQPIQLKNAKCLPAGLETLELINLRTHKDDARVIALELDSLRDLTMKNLGWEGKNLGLRLCDLVKIFERGQLQHLCMKASLNMMSYSELEEDSLSPELNLLVCVVQSNSFAAASRFFLEVWKRECGLYTSKKCSASGGHEEEELDVFQVPNNVELQEEEEEECSSSGSSEEDSEEENDDEEGDSNNDRTEEKENGEEGAAGTDDDEWQECEDNDDDVDDDDSETGEG